MVKSTERIARDASETACALAMKDVGASVRATTRESKIHSKLRNTGIALLVAPDPITDIPGLALLVASHIVKKREAVSLNTLSLEFRKTMKELQFLRL